MRTQTRACETTITTTCERCGCSVTINANKAPRVTYCADCVKLMEFEKACLRKSWINIGTYRVVYDPWDSWSYHSYLCRSDILDYAYKGWLEEGTRFECHGDVYVIQNQQLVRTG